MSPEKKSNEYYLQQKLKSPLKELSSLKTISSESIRQNWLKHELLFTDEKQMYHENFYEFLWDRWYTKFSISRSNKRMELLKDFITDNYKKGVIDKSTKYITDDNVQRNIINNELTLIIKGLGNYSRIEYQKLCDKIGLHHRSYSLTNFAGYKRNEIVYDLYITKPAAWVWEWTIANPYPYSDTHAANPYKDIWAHF